MCRCSDLLGGECFGMTGYKIFYTMFVNRMPFLMGIDKSIRYQSVISVKNRALEQYYQALDVMLHK